MATQNVNIGINVSDNGTAKKVVKNFQEIATAATKAQKAAQTINAPVGGTQGSRAVYAKTAPSGSQQMSGQQYGSARGSAGVTGASARDFANQAQGLGGLVRLYATYAANIFAVGAAFRALSSAMDTTNMIKGLDQLGAASGVALGSLSKRLIIATDGAISMREAMESVAKASSSGMSSDNILRMGKVAKQAAQALGVDMSDAVNRLTRGITKLEPELLDELGIFTRVDAATKAYAKSIGKSAESITDFEKRMAFANAVLEEGEKKFSAIDYETNPYTKLLATLKDVAQSGLEIVNKVLVPIVSVLSESPKALSLAIAGLGLALVKQALPALGQFKAGLAAASEEATRLSAKKSADAVAAQKQLNTLLLQEKDSFAEEEIKKVDSAAERLKKASIKSTSSASRLLETNFAGLSKQELKEVEERIIRVNAQAKKYATLADTAAKAGKDSSIVNSLKEKSLAYQDAGKAAKASLEAEQRYIQTNTEAKKANLVATLQANMAEKARVAAIKQNIVTNAAYNGSLIGPIGAIKLMNEELRNSNLTLSGFSKGMLYAKAGVSALAGVAGTVMSSIGGFLNIIATVSAAVGILSSFLSANGKQLSVFSSSVDTTDESLINLGRTLDTVNKKPFGQQLNSQSLLATATAINEISSSVSSLILNTLAADKAANGFDRFLDGFKTLWGGDLRSQFGKSISTAVFGTLERLEGSPEAKKARDSIASILNVDPDSSKVAWESAFKAIADNEPKLKAVDKAMAALGMATGQTADNAAQFDLRIKESKESLRKFTDQFKVTDPLALFAESLIASGAATAKALETPEAAIGRLASIVSDTQQLQLFGSADQKNLGEYAERIAVVNNSFERQKSVVNSSTAEIRKLEAALEALRGVNEYNGEKSTDVEMAGDAAFERAKKELDKRRAQLVNEQKLLDSTLIEVASLTARFPNIAANQLIKGAGLLSDSISASFAKGSTAFINAVISSVGDLPGLAKQRYSIEMAKLDSESKLLVIQSEMLKATLLNTEQLKKRSAEEAVSIAQSDARQVKDSASATKLQEAQKALADIDQKIAIIKIDPKQALAAIAEVTKASAAGNQAVLKDAQGLLNFINSMAGLALQQRNNADAKKAAAYTKIVGEIKEEYKESDKVLVNQKEQNAAIIASYALQKAKNGSLTEAENISLRNAQVESTNLETAQKNLLVAQKLSVLEKAKTSGGLNLTQEQYDNEKALLIAQLTNNVLAARAKIYDTNLKASKDVYNEQTRQVTLANDLTSIYKQGTYAIEDSKLAVAELNNETTKNIGKYVPEYQAEQDQILAATKVRLAAERQEQELTSQFIIRSYALQAEAKFKLDTKASPESISETENKLAAEAAAYGNKLVAINATRDAELNAIKLVGDARKEQEGFDSLIQSITKLDFVWGNFGTTLANTVTVLQEVGKSQEQYANTIADLESKRDTAKNAQERLSWEKKLDKANKDSTKSEVTNYGKVAGAAKSLFKEKTFAYKALAAVEKAMHITRLAMDVKEMFFDTAKTGTAVANSATRTGASVVEAGVDGVKAVVKAISSLPFPLNIAAGAATAAVVAGLLSQIGGKSPSVGSGGGFTPNAEQRQETQGTGISYDLNGNKVENGGGIFGDSSQKLDSINKGIQTIKDNSIEGLFYDNRMLKALESIAQSITGAAQSLYSTPGIRSGLNFGSLPGTTLDKNWYQDIPLIGGALGSIFGGGISANSSIQDAGIQLRGTLDSIASGISSGVMQYKDILTQFKEDGGWFGSDDYWSELSRQTNAVNADIRQSFADVFTDAKNMFTEVADIAGISSVEVNKAFQSITTNLDISLKGLTGEEVLSELNATISGELDKVAKTLFSSFDQFKKFGEGYTDTVIRVVDGNNKVDAALRAMGSTFDATKDKIENIVIDFGSFMGFGKITTAWTKTTSSFEISETIINKMAGSLERFTDQAKFFIDNFLTEAERMNNTRAGVTEALTDLNLSTDLTREEFKQLVRIQDLSTQTGRDMYQGLMDIQEGFFKTTQTLADLKTEATNLEIELLKAQGRTTEATAALDALATEGMTKTELAAYNYNKALKEQIDAQKSAETVANQRISLEQKLLQLGENTVALRAIELNKLDESNQGLQLQIWAVEDWTKVLNNAKVAVDKAAQAITNSESAIESVRNRATDAYVAATDKVAAAQKTIADLAVEAAKKMQGFGKTLRDFVKDQLMPQTSSTNAQKAFAQNTRLALTGDTAAIEKVPELAQAAIDAAKANARSSEEFNSTRAAILAGVTNVAKFAESQAALTNIQAEEDPLVVANRELESAILEQTAALKTANSIAASLVKTPEDLIQLYVKANEDLATAILEKALAEETQARAQAALDNIVGNTGKLIAAITGTSTETAALAKIVEAELTSGFSTLDKNLDGKLSYDELVKGLDGKATNTQIQDLIKAADTNADGLISAYELELLNNTKSIVEALGNGFDLVDTNLDGKLSYDELVKGLDGKATNTQIQDLIKAADTNADGLISAYELELASSTTSLAKLLIGIDTNLDGKLSYDELVKGLDGKATNTQIKDLIKAVDLNSDNTISSYELELFNNTKSIIEALGSGFDLLDTNLDGKLSEKEFKEGMKGKASDSVLDTIFKLIDADNDKIISATEATAAESAITSSSSAEIVEASAVNAFATAAAGDATIDAISGLNNSNLLTITSNTATTVTAINQLLTDNVALFNAMSAVASNTKSLADSVKAGSGTAAAGSTSSGNFLSVIGKTISGVVGGVVGAVSGVVKSVGGFVKKLFSDERTKKDISLHTRLSNGIGIYDYNYKEPYASMYGTDRKRGVLAQEVKDQYPGAVSVARNGMYMVDYSKLPIPSDMLKFANGGVFSNQVVTRPTSFNIAQMGEAGPEAIMPLTRTSGGKLGIVAQTNPGDSTTREMLNQNIALIQEVRQLREEVSLLRHEARATASSTNKTTRILERVTRNGESLLVTDAATV